MAGSSGTLLLRQRRAASSALSAAVPPLPVAAVVLLLAAAAAAPAAAAPAWLFPPGTTKPPVIEGVQCPSNVVDVPNSAAFPPAPWAASATYRLTTAGAEYELPNAGGPLVVAAGVTVCVVGTRATLRARNDVAFFDLEGGALGLSGVTLRGNGTGPTGVRALNGAAPSKLGAAQASFEDLFVGFIGSVPGSTSAFRDARFVRNAGGGVRVRTVALTFEGESLFQDNVRDLKDTSVASSGAGLFMQSSASAEFRGAAKFVNNRVYDEGSAIVCQVCRLRFKSDAVFERNGPVDTSPGIQGTVYVSSAVGVGFEGRLSRFAANNVVGTEPFNTFSRGAALFNFQANVTFASATTEFVDQIGNLGGVYAQFDANVRFERGAVRVTGGKASLGGSALYAELRAAVSFSPETTLDISGNAAGVGQIFATSGGKVDVQSRWARFVGNTASVRGGALAVENATASFGPATSLTMADNAADTVAGAVYAGANGSVTFLGPTCIKANRAAAAGGALYLMGGSRAVFKDPPSPTSGGGFGCKLPHPLFCPAGQQGQVMGDNSAAVGPTAVVLDGDSAIVCASNGLTRGKGSYVIEGPVCGAACVSGGGNCTCPAGQPFSAADCACKASKPLWPFPHPWLGGGGGGGITGKAGAGAGASSTAAKATVVAPAAAAAAGVAVVAPRKPDSLATAAAAAARARAAPL